MRHEPPRQADFITAKEAGTLPGLFSARVRRSPEGVAYHQFDRQSGSWRDYRWRDAQERVARWRAALGDEGLETGDRVATLVGNGVDWVCFDQAAQSLGLVVVALYTTDTPANLAFILGDAGVRLLLVDEPAQWSRLAARQGEFPALARAWCTGKPDDAAGRDERLVHVDDILPSEGPPYESVPTGTDALATLIYTSGTTGRPKGVMLSHRNILSNAEAVQRHIPAYPEDVFFSFLPLAHGFERTVNHYLPMMAGSSIGYARSVQLLVEDLPVVRPTVFLSAPRLYEKMYAAVNEKVASSPLKRRLLAAAVAAGWQAFEAQQRRGPSPGALRRLETTLLHRLVADRILARLGGRLRVAVTGAAPLPRTVARFFIGLGFPLVEGYGLTEAGPVVSGNGLEHNLPGSVGRPLSGVEVKVAPNGELLVRSDGVMLGYWQREEATREAVDEAGWLHTGDLAEIRDGYIFIRGRIKEILVTSTGEKVAPVDMEMAITLDPLFEQALVVGEGKPYVSALVVLNRKAWEALAAELGLDPRAGSSLASAEARDAVLNRLAALLERFPGYAQVRAVHLACEPWSIENGLLTPTMKLKRGRLERRFAREIRELYRGHVVIE